MFCFFIVPPQERDNICFGKESDLESEPILPSFAVKGRSTGHGIGGGSEMDGGSSNMSFLTVLFVVCPVVLVLGILGTIGCLCEKRYKLAILCFLSLGGMSVGPWIYLLISLQGFVLP